ncbi:nicotinic acid mononucleotide adenylyltransferase [Rhodospirillum rubrum]|uniref:nicotinate-nucleotide adenylyltransferase n=1 Tax=Rhodospirillum rubrum TaxID=1085 RepID=UPI0019063D40|nr:nicotinate-nucleotide adenylyltransferase [Rhodospirillum rubrum]MBK1665135.1 nicotinic acid mononucleotide adenylyltransferase [Rhodospirillum rubrum]MBK1676380.1 nicotinic acid mononucleotide adenylyltransferase [Rhodospirillum rubrum]
MTARRGEAALGKAQAPSPWGDGRRSRIGLLGGSFNPAHQGHLHISKQALARLRLDAVWWLVTPQNPLKAARGVAPLAARLASARAVCARERHILPLALETAFGTTRTADTLDILHRRFPRARFVWLMGADNLAQLPSWHRWRHLAATTPIAILDRAPYSKEALAGLAARRLARFRHPARIAGVLADRAPPAWVFLPIRKHAASATAIRARGWTVSGPVPTDGEGNL